MHQTDDGPDMADPRVEYDQLIEVARLALSRGDRVGAESALTAAIEMTDGGDDLPIERADALMRLGALKHEMGNHADAERFLRDALNVSESALGTDDVGLIPALTSLGTVLIARGAPEEARPLLTRALGISESHFGADHPDLVVLLNELSRLYLKRAAYSFAEPLLMRLLTMKRAKGEEHPEVATILAGLATVRQGLGDHDGAEQLFRRALQIREKTLAPNHFAIATTLEHLADTCAARGKFSEGLQLYQRALPMREMTLGIGHASVRASRERIADLQLQASEDPSDVPVGRDASLAPLLITQALQPPPHALTPTRPIQRRTPALGRTAVPAKEREKTTPAPVPAAVLIAPPSAPPAVKEAEREAPLNRAVFEEAPRPETAVIPWSAELLSVESALKEIDRGETPAARLRAVVGSASVVLQTRSARTAVIVGATGLLLLFGFVVKSRLGRDTDQQIFAEPAPPTAAAMTVAVPPRDSATLSPRLAGSPRDLAGRTRTDSPRVTSPTRSGAADERIGVQKPAANERQVQAPRLPGAFVANIVMSGIDSAARAVNAPTRNLRDSFPDRLAGIGSGRLGSADDVESGRAGTMPRLIGSAPAPKYPDVLRDRRVEGEVMVQFLVDENGRADVSSMKVVRSPHEMLTGAVRSALSQFRFEPARTAAPDSKPRSEWVKFGFQFNATGK